MTGNGGNSSPSIGDSPSDPDVTEMGLPLERS
jgi:hypothetical protein